METKIIEVTNSNSEELGNWGKFLVGRLDTEWDRVSSISTTPLLRERGWRRDALWVLDLETREGAAFHPGGSARADLEKHEIHVCPMFRYFLEWLYQQDLTDLTALPDHVHLRHAPTKLFELRQPGAQVWKKNWTCHPGEILEEWLEEKQCTSDRFAEEARMDKDVVAAILLGTHAVTVQDAIALAQITRVPASLWLSMRWKYELDLFQQGKSQAGA